MASEFEKNFKEYPFVLLREEADDKDAFRNHTHENVADALAVLIERERGGLTIGLEGSWGGGKSTVLKILRRKLTRSYFFFFDAWAHEGDSLRRVFLESLCEYFKSKLDGEESIVRAIDALEKKIDGRKIVTTTSTTRKPTVMGLLSVIAASAATLGVGVLSLSRDANNHFCTWLLVLSLALLSCPAILVVGWSIALAARRWFGKLKKFWTVDNWAFLQSSSTNDQTRDVTEEDERSSVEFERFFGEIVDLVMCVNKETQLVIAIDNLDRVNPEDSLRLWSTLQTFLQKRSVEIANGDWFNRLWIVVPYDAEGLSKLWDQDGNSPEMVKSFMDKCFQIRVEVPRPLMSDWETFAKIKIEESLGKWPPEDKKVVFEILRNTRAGILDIPTPRQIKNYINQIAVVRSHARTGISTAVIAYYVLSRYQEWHAVDKDKHGSEAMSVEDVRKALLWGQYPQFEHRAYLGENYTAMFAGLIFGVDAVSGHELLIGSEIEGALQSGDGQSLQKIEGVHKDGFWNVLDDFLRNQIRYVDSASSFGDFVHRCGALFRAELDMARMGEVRRYVQGIVDALTKRKVEELAFVLPENVSLYDDVADTVRFLERFGNLSLLQKLYSLTIAILNLRLQRKDAPLPTDYGLGVEKMLAACPESIRKVCDVSGLTFARLSEFVPGLDFNGSVSPATLRPAGNAFVSDFVNVVQVNSEVDANIPIMVSFLIRSGSKCDWTPVIERGIKCIYFNNGFSSQNVPATCMLDVLIQIVVADEKMCELVRPILDDWRFYNYVGHDVSARAIKAALLSVIVASDKVLAHNKVPINTNETKLGNLAIADIFLSNDVEVAQQLLSESGRFNAKGKLWNICSVKEAIVFDNLVKMSLQNEADNAFFNYYYGDNYVDDYLRRTGKLGASDAGESVKELVGYLSRRCELWTDIGKNAITEDGILKRSAALAAIVDTGLCPDEVLEKIGRFLSGMSADVVAKMLAEGETILLLHALRRKVVDFRLKHEYYKALGYIWDVDKEERYQKMREELIKSENVEKWKMLVDFCPVSMCDQLQNDIVADFKKMNGTQRYVAYPILRDELKKGISDAVYWEKEAWEALKLSDAGEIKMYADLLAICLERTGWRPDSACTQKYREAIDSQYATAVRDDMKGALKHLATVVGVTITEVPGTDARSENDGGAQRQT